MSPLPSLRRRITLGVLAAAVLGVAWGGMTAQRDGAFQAQLLGDESPFTAQVIGGNMLRFSAQQMAQGQDFPARQQILFTCGPTNNPGLLFGPLLAEDRKIWLWGFLYPGPQGSLGDQSAWKFFFSRRMYSRHPSLAQRPLLREFPEEGGEFFVYADRPLRVTCGVPGGSIDIPPPPSSSSSSVSSASSSVTSVAFDPCPTGEVCTVGRGPSGGCVVGTPPNPPAGMTTIYTGACGGGTCNGTCYKYVPSGPSPSSISSASSSAPSTGQDLPDLVLTHALQGVAQWPDDMLVDLTVRNMGGQEAATHMIEMPLLTSADAAGVEFSRAVTDPACSVVSNRIRCVSTAALAVGASRTYRIGLRTAGVTPCRSLNLVHNAMVNTPADAFFINNAISFMLQARCPLVSSSSSSSAPVVLPPQSSAASSDGRQLMGCQSGRALDPLSGQQKTYTMCVYRELPSPLDGLYVATFVTEANFAGDPQTKVESIFPNSLYLDAPEQNCLWDNYGTSFTCRSWYTAQNPGAQQTRERFTLRPAEECVWQTVNGSIAMRYGRNTQFDGADDRPELRVDFQTEVTCAQASTEQPDLSLSVEVLPQAPVTVPLLNNTVLYRLKVRNQGLGPSNGYTINYRALQAAFTDGQAPLFGDGINVFSPLYGARDCVNGVCTRQRLEPGEEEVFDIIVGSMRYYSFCRSFTHQMEFELGRVEPTNLDNGTLRVAASATHACGTSSASSVAPVTFNLGTTTVGNPYDITFRITDMSHQPQYCAVGPITSVPAGLSIVKNLNTNVDSSFILRVDATAARQISGPLHLTLGVYQGETCSYTLTKTDAFGTQTETKNNLDSQGRPQSTVSIQHLLQGTVNL